MVANLMLLLKTASSKHDIIAFNYAFLQPLCSFYELLLSCVHPYPVVMILIRDAYAGEGRKGSCPLCPFLWGLEGQELPFMLNPFPLSYLVKGHFPTL